MTRKTNIAHVHLAHLQVAPADPRPKLAKELNLACPLALLVILYLRYIFFKMNF
ncbi:MAG: hypothetical protein WC223_12205 [Bacteroidales bacterium]